MYGNEKASWVPPQGGQGLAMGRGEDAQAATILPQGAVLDWGQAERFLALLGKNKKDARLRAIPHKETDEEVKKRLRVHKFQWDRGEAERYQRDGLGIYLVINNGGDKKASIASCVAYFAEFDGISEVDQFKKVIDSGLPEPSIVVRTGGGSLHFYWLLDQSFEDPEQWQKDTKRLIAHLGSDKSVNDPSRVMRLPGCLYMGPDQKPRAQVEIVSSTEARYSREEILACLPPEPIDAPLLAAAPITPTAPPATAPGGIRVPLDDFIAKEYKDLIQRGSAKGSNNEEGMKLSLDLVGTEAWLSCNGATPEPSARDLFQVYVGRSAANYGGGFDNKAAWVRFEGAQVKNPSPSTPEKKLKERLAFHRRQQGGSGTAPKGSAGGTDSPRPADGGGSHAQQLQETDLDRIRINADRVVAENLNFSRPQYVHRLRELVEVEGYLSVQPRDDLYRREIGEAIIRRDGIESKPFVGGCELPDDAEQWIVEALILAGALNIIGADPKAGKTLLTVALIANLLHGCQQFIGCDITGRPPTVIIVGPDQPVRLWKKQLKAVGLVQGNTLDHRIVRLWDSQNPWAATTEGIAELRQLCADHPGSLVFIDSFAKVSEKLGIDENSREAAEVLSDIERACIVSSCTPLVIHHNGKSAGRAGIVNGGALRGSGAIRANASQVVVLTLIDQDNPKDPRRRLVTEGRGGEFMDAVIQLEDDGWSWRHVCDYAEHRTATTTQRTREKLSPGQQAALEAVEASSEPLTTAQVWAALHPETPWVKESSDAKNLSRTLKGLAEKKLLDRSEGPANIPTYAKREA
jgi:hypothetical protein